MLRNVLLALGPAALVVLPLYACDDSDASGGGGIALPSLDASGVDVYTTLPTGDATAPEPDAAPTGVTVTMSGDMIANVPVVFGDADGNPLATVMTGADGKATSTAAGIAVVTALQARGVIHQATTWTSVQPGDVLTLRALPPTGTVGNYTVAIPFTTGFARTFDAYAGPCTTNGVDGEQVTLPLDFACTGTAPTAVLAATSTVGETPSQVFSFTKTGPTSPLDAGSVTVNVPATWVAPSTTVLTVANYKAGTTSASVASIADGLLYLPPSGAIANLADAPVGLPYPTGFGDSLQAEITYAAPRTTGVQAITKRYAPGAAVTLDEGQLLPAITSAGLPDLTEPLRPVLAWAGDTTMTDGGIVTQVFSVSGQRTAFVWSFVVPPGTTSVKAPALGASAFVPADATVTANNASTVQFFEGDAFPDAAAFRQQQGQFFGPFTSQIAKSAPALAADGQQLRATTLVPRLL